MDERARRGMEAQLARRRALLASGAVHVGWKIGLNDPRVQAHLGLDGSVVGHLTLATTLVPGTPHSAHGATRIGAEPELGIHVGRDVGPGVSRAEAAAAVIGLGAAIELVDVDRPFDDVEAIVTANVFHRAVLFGPTHPGVSVAGATATVRRNGAVVETADATGAGEEVPDLVRFVADLLGACGERLRAGDRIIAGSLTRPVWVGAGDVVEVAIGPLGILLLTLD